MKVKAKESVKQLATWRFSVLSVATPKKQEKTAIEDGSVAARRLLAAAAGALADRGPGIAALELPHFLHPFVPEWRRGNDRLGTVWGIQV